MTNFETDNGTTRDDLLQRVALMETMIAEGRCTTQRYGWIFVAWGLCYLIAVAWTALGPHPVWAWPICLAVTILGVNLGLYRQGKAATSRGPVSSMTRTLSAVWLAFGLGIMLFVGAVAASRHFGDVMFISTICFFLGRSTLPAPPSIAGRCRASLASSGGRRPSSRSSQIPTTQASPS